MTDKPKHIEGCNEEDSCAEDCPAAQWEHDYWASYFGIRQGNTPEIKAHNRNQIRAFAPVWREDIDYDE